MRLGGTLLLLSLLALPAPAASLDLCFDDDLGGDTIYVFKKLKLPKRALDATPVAGTRLGQTGVSGTLYRAASGQLRFSLTTADGCFVNVNLLETLEGDAFYSCLNGFTDTSNWTPRDCDELELVL